MAGRGQFKRKPKAGSPAKPEAHDLIEWVEPRQLTEQALLAFGDTFQAIYEQAQVEARRLVRINAALEIIETEVLDPEYVANLTPRQRRELWQTLQYNARGATATLLEISKTIMSSRATAAILANLRAIAMSFNNGGHGPQQPIDSGGSDNGGATFTPSNGSGKMAQRFNGS